MDYQGHKSEHLGFQEGHEYYIRIFAKNEIGFSDPLENDEPFKVVRPAGELKQEVPSSELGWECICHTDYTEEENVAESKRDETPSLSFSTTETSSWMREAGMDADIKSYTTSSVLRRDEYFFRYNELTRPESCFTIKLIHFQNLVLRLQDIQITSNSPQRWKIVLWS